jgi:ABC-2 type transport system ATP-binding protein
MSDGRLVAQGTVSELRGAGLTTVSVTTSRPSDAASVLGRLGVTDVEVVGDEVRGHPGPVAPETIVAALVHADVPVRGFAVTTPSLEDLFVGLTGEGFDVSG